MSITLARRPRTVPPRPTAAHPPRAGALLACALLAMPAAAQTARPTTSPVSPPPREADWMLSVNPLGFVFGGLSGEVERRLGGERSVAAAATYWGTLGASYLSMDGKLRFYRRGGRTRLAGSDTTPTTFEGLSFGPMLGFQRVAFDACAADGGTCSATGVTLGGTVDYGWRLGEKKTIAVVTGGGLKTGFGFGGLEGGVGAGGVRVTYPFLRVAVGYVLPRGR